MRARKSERERGLHEVVVNVDGLAVGRVEKAEWGKRYYGFVGYLSEEPAVEQHTYWMLWGRLEEAIRAANPEPVARR
jgi:hypothetical protein